MAGSSTPGDVSTKQARIAQLAKQMPEKAMRSLAYHMDLAWLQEAYRRTRKDGAAGIDGQTAAEFEEDLDANLRSLLDRAKSGTYRAPPVRRVYIPKGDGSKTRPIGIPTLEDKVLQRAVVMLLEPVYEQDFYDFSYGFRPRRSPHDAVETLGKAIHGMGGGWVLEVDVQSYYDTLDHKELRSVLRQRVVDGVVVRLIGKWLRAGVMEGGSVRYSELGVPQGGVISPLLSNIYLHEVLDKWWVQEVLPRMRGRAVLVRFADDFVMVFSSKEDAFRVYKALPQRLDRFGLTLHPEKTRLVRFRRPPGGGGPKRGSFDFLGFTFYWGRSRRGRWILKQKTAKDRFSRAMRRMNEWLRGARHLPVKRQAEALGRKLRGHFNYYGIRHNSEALGQFHYRVRRRWCYWLSRRTQKSHSGMTWEKFNRLLTRYPLPPPRLAKRWRRRDQRTCVPRSRMH
jgi:group II intron reverse transcriptase/maturase